MTNNVTFRSPPPRRGPVNRRFFLKNHHGFLGILSCTTSLLFVNSVDCLLKIVSACRCWRNLNIHYSILMLTTLHFKAVTMSLQCPSRATHRYRPPLCCSLSEDRLFGDGIGSSFTLAGSTESNVASPAIFVPQLQVGYPFPWSTGSESFLKIAP